MTEEGKGQDFTRLDNSILYLPQPKPRGNTELPLFGYRTGFILSSDNAKGCQEDFGQQSGKLCEMFVRYVSSYDRKDWSEIPDWVTVCRVSRFGTRHITRAQVSLKHLVSEECPGRTYKTMVSTRMSSTGHTRHTPLVSQSGEGVVVSAWSRSRLVPLRKDLGDCKEKQRRKMRDSHMWAGICNLSSHIEQMSLSETAKPRRRKAPRIATAAMTLRAPLYATPLFSHCIAIGHPIIVNTFNKLKQLAIEQHPP
ncbi:hypothetical protein RRG08_053298 [Elysia crispata]|uniref:Uncharacterized protein n=1 Tax=Elysia crispata TaxID=231223 RepID=A0AAE0Z5W3_9GAST|nr:hypothetical protein RRG08_053298 [Elysia crispata]